MGFPTKNHRQTSVLKLEKTSENNRYRWLNKNNCTDCDGKNVKKPSTSHRCYIKNIGIASLSKIDHRSSLMSLLFQFVQFFLIYSYSLCLKTSSPDRVKTKPKISLKRRCGAHLERLENLLGCVCLPVAFSKPSLLYANCFCAFTLIPVSKFIRIFLL